jgi:hypothetical protein
MKVSIIPFSDALLSTSCDPENVTRLNIFDIYGTDDCLLDCQSWQQKQALRSQPAKNYAERRDKKKASRAFDTALVKNQRQVLKVDKRASRSVMLAMRLSFTVHDLVVSSKNGCGSCRFFAALLDGVFLAFPSLIREELLLEWEGYGFFLGVRDKGGDRLLNLQLFAPKGQDIHLRKRSHCLNLCLQYGALPVGR